MVQHQARLKGVILLVTSAVVFSTAGLFTKGVSADAWSIVFWRGVFATVLTLSYLSWRKSIRRELFNMGTSGWAVVLTYVISTPAFIAAFKMTSIANVSLIYAAAPFFAAGLAWLCIKERPALSVIIASLSAFCGVGVIVSGSINQIHLRGDFLALWMTFILAAMMVIYRRFPNTPAAGPSLVGTVLLLPIAASFTDPFAVELSEIPSMAAFGLVFAVASIALAAGARHLPASESALISALETPLGPLWAWLIFTELPALETVIGGAIILTAIITNDSFQHHKAERD